jgi:hypothetical protein
MPARGHFRDWRVRLPSDLGPRALAADRLSELGATSRVFWILAPPYFTGDRRWDGFHPGPGRAAAGITGDLQAVERPIEFKGQSDAEFVLGSAVPHDHDLILSSHSVHTSAAALRTAEARIAEIQARLIRQGKL